MDYTQFPNAILLDNGMYAFHFSAISTIMDYCLRNNWIVLGGDILTSTAEYTYDSWFFSPKQEFNQKHNVTLSILKCQDYINWYQNKYGDCYLCSLVLSDTYLSG